MKKLFEKNKLFVAIVVGAVIISGAIYFGLQNYGKISVKKNNNLLTDNQPVLKETTASKKVLKNDNSSKCLAGEEVLVTKVIDGDTIVVNGGHHIRLLSIDADELGYPCYESAKTRLEELVFNKKVLLEKDKTDIDKYKRCLRYIFLDKQNINLQLVKEGLAVARFYEPDVKYKNEIILAEKTAIAKKVGCKWKK